MSEIKKISGKIINHDNSFYGEILFNNKVIEINQINHYQSNDIIIPGFIDLHCHGGNGFDTMEGSVSIKKMSEFHLSKGTTSLLATTMTNSFENTYKALKNYNSIFEEGYNSNLIGVHLEGPFINPKKLGAQPSLTQEPDINFIKEISKIAEIKVITIAPELKNIDKLIDYLILKKINIQIGHSLASYSCCKKLIDKTNIGFTHLYNAMSGSDYRNPGVLEAALLHGNYAEIICDLNHVNSTSIKIAFKNIENLYTVTDSIFTCGMKNGEYKFLNTLVKKQNNKVFLKGSNILAGSVIDMHTTFLNLVNIGYNLNEAVQLTSYNAAKYLNNNQIGNIKKNKISNFIILNQNLEIKSIYLNGKNL